MMCLLAQLHRQPSAPQNQLARTKDTRLIGSTSPRLNRPWLVCVENQAGSSSLRGADGLPPRPQAKPVQKSYPFPTYPHKCEKSKGSRRRPIGNWRREYVVELVKMGPRLKIILEVVLGSERRHFHLPNANSTVLGAMPMRIRSHEE